MANLVELMESVRNALPGKPSIIKNNKISPLIPLEIGEIRPGKISEDLYKFHEIFPDVFIEKTGFMGAPQNIIVQEELFWDQPAELIFQSDGRFDKQKVFHAPIAVYRIKPNKPNYGLSYQYILFQLGNYQTLQNVDKDLLKKGKIKIYRGIRDNNEYSHPEFKDICEEQYFKILACGFFSHSLVLAFNGSACRYETKHVNDGIIWDFYKEAELIESFAEMQGLFQSYTTLERISSYKFGPNYISLITDLDNLKLFSEWSGEREVHLLDPKRVEKVEFKKSN